MVTYSETSETNLILLKNNTKDMNSTKYNAKSLFLNRELEKILHHNKKIRDLKIVEKYQSNVRKSEKE